jgi:hypothetical protein
MYNGRELLPERVHRKMKGLKNPNFFNSVLVETNVKSEQNNRKLMQSVLHLHTRKDQQDLNQKETKSKKFIRINLRGQ